MEKMRKANFTVASMHGDMPQLERDNITKSFRSGDRYCVFDCTWLIFECWFSVVMLFDL